MKTHKTKKMKENINEIVKTCHEAASNWWIDHENGLPLLESAGKWKKYVVASKLALIHSEVSEALEGDRKDLFDDHLPHRSSLEVELADAFIRLVDLAGALELDLGGAIVEKLAYNAKRADHKPENRAKDGGKRI